MHLRRPPSCGTCCRQSAPGFIYKSHQESNHHLCFGEHTHEDRTWAWVCSRPVLYLRRGTHRCRGASANRFSSRSRSTGEGRRAQSGVQLRSGHEGNCISSRDHRLMCHHVEHVASWSPWTSRPLLVWRSCQMGDLSSGRPPHHSKGSGA